jgi:hypothetical protein
VESERDVLVLAARLALRTAPDEEALRLLGRPLNWEYLLETAVSEGMEGLLACQLTRLARQHDVELPVEPFRRAYHQLFARNGAYLALLSEIRDELRPHEVQTILLKGGALIPAVYEGRPGLRPLSDLDLLVKASDLRPVETVLRGLGFNSSSSSPGFFVRDSLAIDLHTDLVGAARISRRALAFRFDMDALWRAATPIDPDNPTVLVLSPPHQFLHLAVHALKHSYSRLIWAVDLGLLSQRVNGDELVGEAEASGTVRALTYALVGVHSLMRVPLPGDLPDRLPRLNWIEQVFLRRVTSRQRVAPLGEVLVAFSIPDFVGTLGYLRECGFPRREVLTQGYLRRLLGAVVPWVRQSEMRRDITGQMTG